MPTEAEILDIRKEHAHSMDRMAETILRQRSELREQEGTIAEQHTRQENLQLCESQRAELSRINAGLQDEIQHLRQALSAETSKSQGFERAVTDLALKLAAAHEKITSLHKAEVESFSTMAERLREEAPLNSRIAVLSDKLDAQTKLLATYRKDMQALVEENCNLYKTACAKVIWRKPLAPITRRIGIKLRAT